MTDTAHVSLYPGRARSVLLLEMKQHMNGRYYLRLFPLLNWYECSAAFIAKYAVTAAVVRGERQMGWSTYLSPKQREVLDLLVGTPAHEYINQYLKE